MRYFAVILALCFTLAPIEAAVQNSRPDSARIIRVKTKKNKTNGRKAPKRVKRSRNHVN
jgi:hypothetical protein